MSTSHGELPSTKDVVTRVFGDVKEYSKLVGRVPTEDYDYHQAFPAFRRQVSEQSATLVQLMDACTMLLPKRRRVPLVPSVDGDTGGSSPVSQLSEVQRTTVMEAVDSLLENVDTVLDDLRGRKMRSADQLCVTFGSELAAAAAGGKDGGVPMQGNTMAVRRPQLAFETPVDNSDAPFVPMYADTHGKQHRGVAGVHPFADVIRSFAVPAEQLLPSAEIPAAPLESCPLTFVDSPEELQRVVSELMEAKEIAVDLEHHDLYSYQGFTCLMQISSRTADYIVDCLRLRSSMHLLAPLFLSPRVLKVFHGAREDVRWLQKDFSLYLVNFFDTSIALQTLHMPYSLAFAVDHFCQVRLNKRYQTADWRVRPLPAEMVHYARQDTHFLLYVYDRLKALLLNSEGRASVGNLLVHVYNESKRLSLELYTKPQLNPAETFRAALGRSLGGLSPTQERVAREVFNWRDAAAREADDSPTAILHLSCVLAIAAKLPTSARELLRCCSPISSVLRRDVAVLVGLVKSALGELDECARAGDKTCGEGADDAAPTGTAPAAVTGSGRSLYGSRPVGFYRPMTGTLPSVSARAAPAAFVHAAGSSAASGGVGAPSLEVTAAVASRPSRWFCAMSQLARTLAASRHAPVPLPGSGLLANLQARAQRRLAEAETQAKVERPDTAEGPVRKRARSSEGASEEHEDDAGEGELNATTLSSAVNQCEEGTKVDVDLPSGAFALRQTFGTGAQDRKRSKSAAAKKGGAKGV